MTNPTPTPVEPTYEYQSRAERRAERRAGRADAPGWVFGAILILVGLMLMGQNFGLRTFNNWWALFILIPAAGAFSNGLRQYRTGGSSDAAGSFLFAGIFTLLALYFLVGFSINWALFGPLALIGGGILLVVQFMRRQ